MEAEVELEDGDVREMTFWGDASCVEQEVSDGNERILKDVRMRGGEGLLLVVRIGAPTRECMELPIYRERSGSEGQGNQDEEADDLDGDQTDTQT